MTYRTYNALPEEARAIRQAVFVEEQGFDGEFDERDAASTHLVFFLEETPVAVCRMFPGENPEEYTLGRVAVLKAYRGQGIGTQVLAAAEETVRAKGRHIVALGAQIHATAFYEKCGYVPYGEIYFEGDCPHIHMKKVLPLF